MSFSRTSSHQVKMVGGPCAAAKDGGCGKLASSGQPSPTLRGAERVNTSFNFIHGACTCSVLRLLSEY